MTSDTDLVFAIELTRVPTDPKARCNVEMVVATGLGVALGEARILVERAPVRLPIRSSKTEADDLRAKIEAAGGHASSVAAPPAEPCPSHPKLAADLACGKCGAPLCAVCTDDPANARCAACAGKAARSRTFYKIRVAVLLVILLGVALYAWRDVERRRSRTDWSRTLDVALVLVEREPVATSATDNVKSRSDALEDRLAEEMRRFRADGSQPFRIHVFGPVKMTDAAPKPGEPGFVSDARFAWDSWRYTSAIDDAVDLDAGRFDTRIYMVLSPPSSSKLKLIEGTSEQGGRVGIVDVELDDTMVDFALFVAAHELFHTLGATDKYDASGAIFIPDGLAEPDRQPRFPQPFVELMARHRPVSPEATKPPKSLDELRVGAKTASEIGWR